ncbi:MAG TPA: FMN-binding protein [Phototrophicaceae bacterium]|nr:FMN-binding protein [Phototrophicaceae bacterium]
MSDLRSAQPSPLLITVRKVVVSAAVILIFAAYVINQRFADHAAADLPPLLITPAPTTVSPRGIISSSVVGQPSPPAPTIVSNATYRDGIYSGNEADASWGLVQVQATIQGGKLTDVQFLDYPRDRRTSQQINAIAMPYLVREALQAQSGHVDVISGATLTSQAFVASLTDALNQAQTTS